ncbi:preprotein translocase subunit SecY [Candidatus Bathyarchaeota archaeon]|nr:preprotein translocase subunit SecY [Candidatus Bathyarchaeota archaeon]MCK4481599.1 preprotein translocase subunit SecY [Candidatus Bathyarchaeota archaeon]
MAGRFLNLFKPIARILPEIKAPERRVRFNEKLFWTAMVLIIYLIMTEIPLYGIETTALGELAALRIIFASSRGSLMELGIGPIVTAGLILQLLAGSDMIDCDMSRAEDRSLFTTTSKAFSIILTGVQASAYIIGGMYGDMPGTAAVIVFLQLLTAGVIVMLLDELVQKGWGFGSGISLFIMAGVAQQIFWQSFSPGTGLFVGGLSIVLSGSEPITSWIFGMGAYPSLIGFIATVVAFVIIIYMEGVRVELPLSYAGYRGFRSRYPIKLLYVSNLPVIFASALFANVYFFSQMFWSMNGQPTPGRNFWLDLLGQFRWVGEGEQSSLQPVGGLVYYVLSPRSFSHVMADPWKALIYLGILIAFCVVFSLTWLEVGGLDPSTVAKQLVGAGMQIPGYRRSGKAIESVLKRYIPVVTILGGIVVALISGVSDFFGVFGSGMGILLSVGIVYQYYEILVRERAAEIYPAFRKIFGG